MRASTKRKLEAVSNQIDYLSADTAKTDKMIKYLTIGIVGVVIIVFFVVFLKKRRR